MRDALSRTGFEGRGLYQGAARGGHFTSGQDMSVTFEDMSVTFVGIRYVLVTIALQGKCTLAV